MNIERKFFFIVNNFSSAISRLEEFSRLYSDSPLLAEAILIENQARFQLGQFEGVEAELNTNLSTAGVWVDRYLFWIGEAQFALGHFTESAETYGVLIENYPEQDGQRPFRPLALRRCGHLPGCRVEIVGFRKNGWAMRLTQTGREQELKTRVWEKGSPFYP